MFWMIIVEIIIRRKTWKSFSSKFKENPKALKIKTINSIVSRFFPGNP